MSTTGVNFIVLNASAGSSAGANGTVLAVKKSLANSLSSSGYGVIVDTPFDLSTAGFAKNGCVVLSLAPSGSATVDLTNLSGAGPAAGDLTFANWNALILTQIPQTTAQDVAVTPGGSNPARIPISGTTPSYDLYGNSQTVWQSPAGQAVDGTHKTITFTNPSGSNPAVVALCVAGS
jgi:hypothetical protein